MDMREAVMTSMRADRARMDEVLHSALSMAEGALPADQPNTEEQEWWSAVNADCWIPRIPTWLVPCSTRSRVRASVASAGSMP